MIDNSRVRCRIMMSGILVIVAFVASSLYDVWDSRRGSLEETDRELTNLTTALSEQTAWTWRDLDSLLQDTASWYMREGRELRPELVDRILADRGAGLRQVGELVIVDAQGIQRHRSHGLLVSGLDVSDRSYFIEQRDRLSTGLFISEPIVTRTQKRSAVELSRRLVDDKGKFAGIVAATIELQNLTTLYAAVNLGGGSAIQLLRNDGALLTRTPPGPGLVGRKFPQLVAAADALPSKAVSPIDGKGVFMAVARVRDAPLVLAVTREETAVLHAWLDQAHRVMLRTLGGTVLGALAIALLLRQLVRIEASERALLESKEREGQAHKLVALGSLAGVIAHDFNNILGAILGYGELALEQSPERGPSRRYIANVVHAGERAKRLVCRILKFSRKRATEYVPVNVQAIVQETLELLRATLPPAIRLESTLEAGNSAVMGDATELHEVIMNLCTNAVHAMRNGGTLRVALENVDVRGSHALRRGAVSAGPYVQLTVADTGAGIPPAVVDRIFEPFFTTKRVGDGTGLGLALVHAIVHDLRGAIDLSTHVGDGTTFTIWLPSAGEVTSAAEEQSAEVERGNGASVMIVDDEPMLVALAEELLTGLGYVPVPFESSRGALEAFRSDPQRFDLVLTDEIMPGLTGIELATAIGQIRLDVPILLMSGCGAEQLAMTAGATGITQVLQKPLQCRELAEALARYNTRVASDWGRRLKRVAD